MQNKYAAGDMKLTVHSSESIMLHLTKLMESTSENGQLNREVVWDHSIKRQYNEIYNI